MIPREMNATQTRHVVMRVPFKYEGCSAQRANAGRPRSDGRHAHSTMEPHAGPERCLIPGNARAIELRPGAPSGARGETPGGARVLPGRAGGAVPRSECCPHD